MVETYEIGLFAFCCTADLFGDRDKAEGQREQTVQPPQAAPECNRTMQLLHVGHIIRFPS